NRSQSQVTAPLSHIVADSKLQLRIGGVDLEYVRELEQVAEYCPPIQVVQRGDKYLIVDGCHRFAIGKQRGREAIPVVVLDVAENEDHLALTFCQDSARACKVTLG